MKTQNPTLVAVVLLGLGLVMLAGDSRAQTREDANCIANMISQAGGRRARGMVMRILEHFKNRNGTKTIGEKMSSMMQMCTCSEVNPDATDAQICQCVDEVKECDMMHKPNSTTAPEEIQGKYNSWMECMGGERLSSALGCKETLFTNPAQMLCEMKNLKGICTQTE
ncbi:uncharacterized protein LOC127007090 [Eriocheir sinensis]|uniref:uncharacterized protein LOC127007090 n=1 Tax=Eriocheir sinensis TaxID=95602 RepID=UPI0021C7C5CD|nr:uncharacterized protein LOC127007090 [Eriocheir sinensis]